MGFSGSKLRRYPKVLKFLHHFVEGRPQSEVGMNLVVPHSGPPIEGYVLLRSPKESWDFLKCKIFRSRLPYDTNKRVDCTSTVIAEAIPGSRRTEGLTWWRPGHYCGSADWKAPLT